MKPSEMARILGRKGGRARARQLRAPERARIAALGGRARAESGRATRRILDNLRYADAVSQLKPPAPVVRLRVCTEPLPGLVRRLP